MASDEKAKRYRKVQPRMWADRKIKRLTWPPPGGLALFWYLMTGRETCALPGAMEVTEGGLSERLRWPLEGLREAFSEVCAEGLAKADWEAPLLWLPGGPKNNKPESPNVVISWGKAFNELPECDLKVEIYQDVRAYLEGLTPGYAKAFREAFEEPWPQASPNQEQEQEQEQEQQAHWRAPACLTREQVAEHWHEAMHGEDGNPAGLHAVRQWADAYATIVAGIVAAVPEAQRVTAAQALCEWFWHAPDGPVQSGRLPATRANPDHLAKRVSTDLEAASEWWAEQEHAA